MKGVRLDKGRLKEHVKENNKALQTHEVALREELGYELNVKSAPQMKKLLYEDLGLPMKYNKKTRRVTTDEKALTALAKVSDNPILLRIIEIRKLRTNNDTFLKKMIPDEDGKIHTLYGITETGRLSSGKDLLDRGTNLQNIPKPIRDIFIPEDGMVMIAADLSQADTRVVAWLADENSMKQRFIDGNSIHKFVCQMVFDIPEESIDKGSKEYKHSKNISHGRNYGMGVRTLADYVGCSSKEARQYGEEYDKSFPNIRGVFHTDIEQMILKGRTLINPYGRKRVFLGRYGPALLGEAYNYLPQSTVADYINRGMIYIEYVIPEDCDLLMQIHDEVVLQVPIAKTEEVSKMLKEWIEEPVMVKNDMLTIPLEISIGKDWLNTVEVEVE